MKTRKRLIILLISTGIPFLCYIAGYLHFVRPMPVRANGVERVEPVFRTGSSAIISLFRPAVAVDQEFFQTRWELAHFQLAPTNLEGLRKMSPFRARIEQVGRFTPNNTGQSALQVGLRLESGHYLRIDEPKATEQMFAIAGSLQDLQLHEFPSSWFDSKIAK